MSQTQSIIVYRNPAEAAFWESGLAWPLFFFLGTLVLVAVILDKLVWKRLKKMGYHWAARYGDIYSVVLIVVSLLISGGITQYLFPVF